MTAVKRHDGPTNMRLDAELLTAAEEGRSGWRVYGWDSAWVTVGRFQAAERDLVAPAETRWVRRPTGGKAVLHGHDVTVGLALPLAVFRGVDLRSIKSVYRMAVGPIVMALRACEVDAALAEDSKFGGKGARTGDCFAFSSPNDVVHVQSGRKLCGCALRLTHRAVLVQASIPNGEPLVQPSSVIVNAETVVPFEWKSANFETAFGAALNVFLEAQ